MTPTTQMVRGLCKLPMVLKYLWFKTTVRAQSWSDSIFHADFLLVVLYILLDSCYHALFMMTSYSLYFLYTCILCEALNLMSIWSSQLWDQQWKNHLNRAYCSICISFFFKYQNCIIFFIFLFIFLQFFYMYWLNYKSN